MYEEIWGKNSRSSGEHYYYLLANKKLVISNRFLEYANTLRIKNFLRDINVIYIFINIMIKIH